MVWCISVVDQAYNWCQSVLLEQSSTVVATLYIMIRERVAGNGVGRLYNVNGVFFVCFFYLNSFRAQAILPSHQRKNLRFLLRTNIIL